MIEIAARGGKRARAADWVLTHVVGDLGADTKSTEGDDGEKLHIHTHRQSSLPATVADIALATDPSRIAILVAHKERICRV